MTRFTHTADWQLGLKLRYLQPERAAQLRLQAVRAIAKVAKARRLWEVLSEEGRRVVERLTAPVTARVRPYLQDLFPGSVLDAGERLDVMGLQSDQLKEPFAELSGGAQEQISLLTRIGIAEVLAADGMLPLVLDDALNQHGSRAYTAHSPAAVPGS